MKNKLMIFLLFIFFLSCAKKEKEVVSFPVGVVKVEKKDLSKYLYFTGELKAQDEVEVYARVTGKIYEKLVKKGDSIKKDEVLFTIDRDEVGYKFEKAKVESPINGKVSMVYVDIGDSVSVNKPLALVQDDSVVKVRIWVGENDYAWIKEGNLSYLKVLTYPDEEFQGIVKEISPFFDPITHTALVEVEVINSEGKLKPGMFTEVKIEVDKKKAVLSIPFDSILKDEYGEYVYVVENDTAFKKYIQIGLKTDYYLEVISGLKDNDLVVHTGEEFLKNNFKVKAVLE